MFPFANSCQDDQNTPFFQDNYEKSSLFTSQAQQQFSAFDLFNSNEDANRLTGSSYYNVGEMGKQSKKSIILELEEFDRGQAFKQLRESYVKEQEIEKIQHYNDGGNQIQKNLGTNITNSDCKLAESQVKIFEQSELYKKSQSSLYNEQQIQKEAVASKNKFNLNINFNRNKQKRSNTFMDLNASKYQSTVSNTLSSIQTKKQLQTTNLAQGTGKNGISSGLDYEYSFKGKKQVPKLQKNANKDLKQSKQDKINIKKAEQNDLQKELVQQNKNIKQQPRAKFQQFFKLNQKLKGSRLLQNDQNIKQKQLQEENRQKTVNKQQRLSKLSLSFRNTEVNSQKPFGSDLSGSQATIRQKSYQNQIQNKNKTNTNKFLVPNFKNLLKKSKVQDTVKKQLKQISPKLAQKPINNSKSQTDNQKAQSKQINIDPSNKLANEEIIDIVQNQNEKNKGSKSNKINFNFKKTQNLINTQNSNNRQRALNKEAQQDNKTKNNTISDNRIKSNTSSMAEQKIQQVNKVKQKPLFNLKLFKQASHQNHNIVSNHSNPITNTNNVNNDRISKPANVRNAQKQKSQKIKLQNIKKIQNNIVKQQISKRQDITTVKLLKNITFGRELGFKTTPNAEGNQFKQKNLPNLKQKPIQQIKEKTPPKIFKIEQKSKNKQISNNRETQKINQPTNKPIKQERLSQRHDSVTNLSIYRVDYTKYEEQINSIYEEIDKTKRRYLSCQNSYKDLFLLMNKANNILNGRFMSQTQSKEDGDGSKELELSKVDQQPNPKQKDREDKQKQKQPTNPLKFPTSKKQIKYIKIQR